MNLTQEHFAILVVFTAFVVVFVTPQMAYADGDDNGNKQKAEDNSNAAMADCDQNTEIHIGSISSGADGVGSGFECTANAVSVVMIVTLPG